MRRCFGPTALALALTLLLLTSASADGSSAEKRGTPRGKEWWTLGAQARRAQAGLFRPAEAVDNAAARGRLLAASTPAKPPPPPPSKASAAPPPLQLLPSSIYNPNLGAWDTTYNASVMSQQRAAGAKLRSQIMAAAAAGKQTFTIPPGTYRLNDTIPIQDTVGFTLVAKGVELIVEGTSLHFQLTNNTGLAILGPLTLDADPMGFSQGTIVGTDNSSYILYRLMPGYPPPETDVRIMIFDADGTMQPLYQVSTLNVTELKKQPGVYNVTLQDGFWTSYDVARRQAVKVGNYMAVQASTLSGGLNLNGNDGVLLADFSVHAASLIFGTMERGLVSVERLAGVRRPGTNRLAAGGFVAISLRGGSFLIRDSELSYNFDDISDIQVNIQYAYKQISPTQVYISYPDAPALPIPLVFYNLETLERDGAANVTKLQPVTNASLTAAFQNGLTDLGLLNWNNSIMLATLDRPINMSGTYDLIDDQTAKAKAIVFEDNYFHDSLAAGIAAKGAQSIAIRNNTVVRAGNGGASVSMSPYWWEGSVSENILIEGNIIHATPYSLNVEEAAINTLVDSPNSLLRLATATPIHNVTVSGNHITDPPVAGIALAFAAHNRIFDNTIDRPGARQADRGNGDSSEPFAAAAAIYLDVVSGATEIRGNTVVDAFPQTTPQMVRISSATDPAGISLCNNTYFSGDGQQSAVPDEFWTSLASNSSQVAYRSPGARAPTPAPANASHTFPALGDRLNSTFAFTLLSAANASAAFSFNGTRARWSGCVGPQYGLAAVYLDGNLTAQVDASLVNVPDVTPDPAVGFCDQMLFDTGLLSKGPHTLNITVMGTPGGQSAKGGTAVAIEGFSYLKGISSCQPAPSAPAALASPAGQPAASPLPAANPQPPPGIASIATRPPVRYSPTLNFISTAG